MHKKKNSDSIRRSFKAGVVSIAGNFFCVNFGDPEIDGKSFVCMAGKWRCRLWWHYAKSCKRTRRGQIHIRSRLSSLTFCFDLRHLRLSTARGRFSPQGTDLFQPPGAVFTPGQRSLSTARGRFHPRAPMSFNRPGPFSPQGTDLFPINAHTKAWLVY